MSSFWIPPPNIRVRIAASLSHKVLYSHERNNHYIGHTDRDETWDDHFFYIIPGYGKQSNLYRIKSAHTQEAIYLNRGVVGSCDWNASFADQWFYFEPGTGSKNGLFRMTCPEVNTVMFSRTHMEPYVGIVSIPECFDDQYFSFLPEELEIQNIEYKYNEGTILDSRPETVARTTAINNYPTTQEKKVKLVGSFSRESSWEHSFSSTFSVSATVSFGIPDIAGGEISASAEESRTTTKSTKDGITTTYEDETTISVEPRTAMKVFVNATKSSISVPMVVTWRSTKTGQIMTTTGTYKGVACYDFSTEWRQVEINGAK